MTDLNKKITDFVNERFQDSVKKKGIALKRAETLISRGLSDEKVIYSLVTDEISKDKPQKRKLPAEMYDKVNYMCRRHMDRMVHFELDYDFVPDVEALKTVIICFFEAAPVMHSSFVDNHIAPYWRVCDYHIDEVLTVKEVDDLSVAADEFLLRDIDVKSNVQMKIGLFTKNDACKICFLFNHMCMDGGDLKRFLHGLIQNYNGYVQSGEPPVNFYSGTRAYKRVYDDLSREDKSKAKKLFANVSAHDKHSLPFSAKSKDDYKIIARKKIGKDVFETARAVGKSYGATANDVIVAAYIRAFYSVSDCPENERVGVSCAVDLRRYIKDIETTGYTNHTTFMPCIVESKGKDMLETLKAVVKSTGEAKQDKFMGLHGLPLLNMGYSTMVYAQAELVVGAFYTNANLAVSNIGALDTAALSIDGHLPVDATFAGAVKNKPCALMSALSTNGNLSLTVCINGNEKDKELLDNFFDAIEKNIVELAKVQ